MREQTDPFPYEDIVNLPHHRSQTHPHMSIHDRAAQFAPFAALSGHDEVIKQAEYEEEEIYKNLYKS